MLVSKTFATDGGVSSVFLHDTCTLGRCKATLQKQKMHTRFEWVNTPLCQLTYVFPFPKKGLSHRLLRPNHGITQYRIVFFTFWQTSSAHRRQ